MSEENAAVTEPEDDAVVVDVDPVVAEEKANDELVAEVTKLLDEQEEAPAGKTGEDEKEKEPSKDDETGELSQDLLARAESAGITKELAERLNQGGQLEETLAAFDRKMIDYVQSKDKTTDSEKPPKSEERREQEPPLTVDQTSMSPLNPDDYDEEIVKRDAYHQQRIDALEARLDEIYGQQQSTFEKRFDSVIDGLKHDGLFGKGDSIPDDKQANRDTLFKAYSAVCLAYDVDPTDCKPEWVERALGAMFPKEVFKQAQQQTVDRLRDAQGKFLTKPGSSGGPPPKAASPEEDNEQLVAEVGAYLKEQGVH